MQDIRPPHAHKRVQENQFVEDDDSTFDDDWPSFANISKNTKKIIVIASIIVIGGFIAYWFVIRPANIRKQCSNMAVSDFHGFIGAPVFQQDYDGTYQACINERGL